MSRHNVDLRVRHFAAMTYGYPGLSREMAQVHRRAARRRLVAEWKAKAVTVAKGVGLFLAFVACGVDLP